MASFDIELPKIDEKTLGDAKAIKQVMDYLFQLNEQLKYVLSHLDGENMTETFKEEVQSSEAIQKFERKLESTDGAVQSVLKQTAEGFKLYVRKDDVINSINNSSEVDVNGDYIKLNASKILLEGYTTINGAFTVDEEGYLRCSGGTVGAFTVTGNGAIMGNGSMMVGSMTMDGSTITGLKSAPNLKIGRANIDEGKYGLQQNNYVMGIGNDGKLDFGIPYVTINGTEYPLNYTYGTPPGGGTATSVTAIRILADNLHKRASNSASSESLGYVQSGELYQGSISGNWAYCTYELVHTSDGYTSIPLDRSFYCATQSSSGKKYVEQTTVQLA